MQLHATNKITTTAIKIAQFFTTHLASRLQRMRQENHDPSLTLIYYYVRIIKHLYFTLMIFGSRSISPCLSSTHPGCVCDKKGGGERERVVGCVPRTVGCLGHVLLSLYTIFHLCASPLATTQRRCTHPSPPANREEGWTTTALEPAHVPERYTHKEEESAPWNKLLNKLLDAAIGLTLTHKDRSYIKSLP